MCPQQAVRAKNRFINALQTRCSRGRAAFTMLSWRERTRISMVRIPETYLNPSATEKSKKGKFLFFEFRSGLARWKTISSKRIRVVLKLQCALSTTEVMCKKIEIRAPKANLRCIGSPRPNSSSSETKRTQWDHYQDHSSRERIRLHFCHRNYSAFFHAVLAEHISKWGGSMISPILAYDDQGLEGGSMVKNLHTFLLEMGCFCFNKQQPFASLALKPDMVLLEDEKLWWACILLRPVFKSNIPMSRLQSIHHCDCPLLKLWAFLVLSKTIKGSY